VANGPKFYIDDLSASVIQDVAHRVYNLKGGPGIELHNDANGITVSLIPQQRRGAYSAPPSPRASCRITAISGAWPIWGYTVQRVIGYDSSKAWPLCHLTDGKDLVGVNRIEFTPASYPALCGEGVMIQDATGLVATTFAGGTASICLVRPPIVGDTVDCDLFADANGGALTALFTWPRSAQPD
jgi:hypothetical protein